MWEESKSMKLDWMQNHRVMVEKMIKYGNAYAVGYTKQRNFGTSEEFSPSQIQTFEYILESEDRNEKMSEMAVRLGVSRSTFSKNVKTLMEKGMLEKFRRVGNRKDIFVKPTDKGREIYTTYVNFVNEVCFKEMFRIADEISVEDRDRFIKLLDIFAESFLWYFSGDQDNKNNSKTDLLIKID
jgi:DNA-binding MarR family transcriptional regulator